MNDSILETIRHMVGGGEEHSYFDTDLIVYINSAIATLRRLGVGPANGFAITGVEETWADLLAGEENPALYEQVKSLIAMKVRYMFDPPTTGAVSEAVKTNIAELEWNLNATYEVGV